MRLVNLNFGHLQTIEVTVLPRNLQRANSPLENVNPDANWGKQTPVFLDTLHRIDEKVDIRLELRLQSDCEKFEGEYVIGETDELRGWRIVEKGEKLYKEKLFLAEDGLSAASDYFRKDWQRRVRTHFDQPGRKSRRRNARLAKAVAVAPRPVDRLRPIVRCPSIKYNRRVRAGRGFSLAELKEAGIPRKLAPTIGISVDPRRANLSIESLTANVERLKTYRARLILFPRKSGQYKKSDSSKEEVEAAMTREGMAHKTHHVMPVLNIAKEEAVGEVKRSEMPKGTEKAYRTLRDARSEARLVGVREKRAKAKADEASAAKK
ncbi:MAG: hypothetical protein Q9164_004773 [Protoblastenia rupestris]